MQLRSSVAGCNNGARPRRVVRLDMPDLSTLVILIAEDDKLLAEIAAETLREEGHTVLLAHDGDEALLKLHQDSAVDLLLTDINMPRRNGISLAKAAKTAWPSLAVMFTSGRVFEPREFPFPATFLAKPFTARQLIAAVGKRDLGDLRVS